MDEPAGGPPEWRWSVRKVYLGVVLAMVAMSCVALDTVSGPRRSAVAKSPLKEAAANVMRVAQALEAEHASGSLSYTTGAEEGGCPGSATYDSGEATVGTFPLALSGDYYRYTVTTTDADGDGKCEAYEVTATGVRSPVTGRTLGYLSGGAKTGDWDWKPRGPRRLCGCSLPGA